MIRPPRTIKLIRVASKSNRTGYDGLNRLNTDEYLYAKVCVRVKVFA
jgi:hypothetical protein